MASGIDDQTAVGTTLFWGLIFEVMLEKCRVLGLGILMPDRPTVSERETYVVVGLDAAQSPLMLLIRTHVSSGHTVGIWETKPVYLSNSSPSKLCEFNKLRFLIEVDSSKLASAISSFNFFCRTRVSIFSHYFSCSWVQTTAPESEQHKSEDEMSGSSAIAQLGDL